MRWDEAERVAGVELLRGDAWDPVLGCGPAEGGWGCERLPREGRPEVSLTAIEGTDASGPYVDVVASIGGFANQPKRRLRYSDRGRLLEARVEGEGEVTAQRTHLLEYDTAGRVAAVGQRFDWLHQGDGGREMQSPPVDAEGRILPASLHVSQRTRERFEQLRGRGDKRAELGRDGSGMLDEIAVQWPNALLGCPVTLPDSIPRDGLLSPAESELCRAGGPLPGRDLFTRDEFLGMRVANSGSAPSEVARQAAGSLVIEASGSGGRGEMRWRVTFSPSTVYRLEYLDARHAMVFRETLMWSYRLVSDLGFLVELPVDGAQRDLRIVETIGWGGNAPRPVDDDAVSEVLRRLLDARAGWPEVFSDPEAEVFDDESSRVVVLRGKALWRRLDGRGRVVAFAEGSFAKWERVFFGAACDSWPGHVVPPIRLEGGS